MSTSLEQSARRRVAVVTGGGRGIGRAIARALAADGFDLVLGWNRSAADAEETANLAGAIGATVRLVQGDIAQELSAEALVAAAQELGGLDLWVNNAGISVLAPVLETSSEDARRLMDVNFLGTFHGLVAAGRVMSAAGSGRIVNVASDLGVHGAALLAVYAATKFAVVGLTQSAALELAAHGVTVNALCPGTVETEMVLAEEAAEAAIHGISIDEVRARLLAAVPAGRLCHPEDVAGLVSFLASPAAAYVTGQAICVNGGSILH